MTEEFTPRAAEEMLERGAKGRMVEVKECNRCHWSWAKRGKREPKECPHCTSRYWNRERVYKRKEAYA